jgi:hypothetical protein
MHDSPLRDDLDFLNKSFPQNPLNTDWQKAAYGAFGQLSPGQWAVSNPANILPLVLSEEDGYDGEPVGSQSAERSRKFFAKGEARFLPKIRDIVRAGFFFHLDIFRLLTLCIKREWEAYLSAREEKKNEESKREAIYTGEDRGYDTGIGRGPGFYPPTDKIYETLAGERGVLEANTLHSPTLKAQKELDRISSLYYTDYDEKTFDVLGREILLNALYFHAIDSKELLRFIRFKAAETNMLKHTSDHDKQLFLMFKSTWLDLEIELLKVTDEGVSAYIRYRQLLGDFLAMFGAEYIALQQTEKNLRIINLKLAFRKEEPAASEKRISGLVRGEESLLEERIEALEATAEDARHALNGGSGMSDESGSESRIPDRGAAIYWACMYFLEPGKPEKHPKHESLKAEHRERLVSLLEQVNTIIKKERKNHNGLSSMGEDSVLELGRILDEARRLLVFSEPDSAIHYIIHGSTVKEQVRWLQTRIDSLEREITVVKSEITALRLDIEEKKKVLSSPRDFEKHRAGLKEKNDTRTKEYEKLAEHYEKLVSGNAT